MNPVGNEVPVNIPLTLVQSAYIQAQIRAGYFIADQVFPRVPVKQKRANYNVWDVDNWLRADAQRRAPGTESVGGGYTMSQNPLYNCYVTAFHKDLDAQTEAEQLANGIQNPRETATRYVTRQLLLRREMDFASAYMTTGVWGTDLTGHATLNTGSNFIYFDDSTSTPIDIIGELIEQMVHDTGFAPNTLVTTRRVRRALRRNAQIRAEAHAIAPKTGEALPTDLLLQELLEIDRIIVAQAVYNAAAEGETRNIQSIYGNDLLLCYVDPEAANTQNGDLNVPSAGYIFPWTGYKAGQAGFDGNATYEIPMPLTQSVRVEGEMAYDMRITSPLMGIYLHNVLTP